jgi:hypothetical protein
MHRHPRGTCISTDEASIDVESRPPPIPAFLRGLGVVATLAVAVLALTAMLNPALAGLSGNPPSSERITGT